MKREYMFNGQNIIGDIKILISNIPTNVSTEEKIRWIYIKLGKLFSYDYRIADNENVANKKVNIEKDSYVGRYQTCLQISTVLCDVLNKIGPECHADYFERPREGRGVFKHEHQAVEVQTSKGNKYLLDLTLDLYLIQSGCQTMQFGFTSDSENEFDIIPLVDCEKMDHHLGLMPNEGYYTNKKILRLKQKFAIQNYENYSEKEIIEERIKDIKKLIPEFNGHYEGKQFVNKLFKELLGYNYAEYNLTYRGNDNMNTLFIIMDKENKEHWYIYSNYYGLFSTNISNINTMLNSGWVTRSNTLEEKIGR
jgi:hypothetical protein